MILSLARGRQSGSRPKGNRTMVYILVFVLGSFLIYTFVYPLFTTKLPPGQAISLNPSTDLSGSVITIAGKNLTSDQNITARFDGQSIVLTGTCSTDHNGILAGCYFVTPRASSGPHNVTVTAGAMVVSARFTVPNITPAYSTVLVVLTSLGLGTVTQLVTRRVVDLGAERRMKAEVRAFNDEKRQMTLELSRLKGKEDRASMDRARQAQVKLDKLKKRELPMKQENAKVSSARLKVTAITFVPLLGTYYLMSYVLGGFSVVVAFTPIYIPVFAGTLALNGGWQVSLFMWYFFSSLTISSILTRVFHTTT